MKVRESFFGFQPQTLTAGATPSWNWNAGSTVQITADQDMAISMSNILTGVIGRLKVVQDATGGRAVTFSNATLIGTINTTPNATTFLEAWKSADGTTYIAPRGVLSLAAVSPELLLTKNGINHILSANHVPSEINGGATATMTLDTNPKWDITLDQDMLIDVAGHYRGGTFEFNVINPTVAARTISYSTDFDSFWETNLATKVIPTTKRILVWGIVCELNLGGLSLFPCESGEGAS